MPRNTVSHRNRRRRRKGFTMVEMLTVVLILSILMSIALPLYLNAVDNSKRRICRVNMASIGNAMVAARNKARSADFTVLIAGGVTTANLPDLTAVPICPNGGAYSLAVGSSTTATTFKVQCNTTYPLTHGKFEPGIDSN